MVQRGKKIQELTPRTDLNLNDKLPLVDPNGIAHHTTLQTLKGLISGTETGNITSGVLIVDEEEVNLQDSNEFAILINAENNTVTCILPIPTLGKHFVFKKIDSSNNNVIIKTSFNSATANSEPKIDGQDTQTLFQQYESLTLISDGNNWFIL